MTRFTIGMSVLAVAASLAVAVPAAQADEAPYRIYAGRDFRGYTVAELQRRVYDLERAVMQLQERIYRLEAAPPVVMAPPPPPPMPWTCNVSAFGQNYVQTAPSRGQAEALVRKQCADASHEMHCRNVHCSQ